MSLLHDQWHRVRTLTPQWQQGVRMDRQFLRGECWYLLSDEQGKKTVRLDSRAYAIAGRCDGQRTLEQIWLALLTAKPVDGIEQGTTQGDVMALVTRLIGDGLFECRQATDLQALGEQANTSQRQQQRARLMPWALRCRLGDPSTLLARCGPLARTLFGPVGAFGWLVLVVSAGWIALERAAPLMREVHLAMASPSAWLQAWLVFVPMKAVHEAAHALAIRRFGGTVHEAGIGLLLGLPAPYVDASQASRLGGARQRALVSAAGILAELALAAIGVLVWAHSDPGSIAQRLALIVAVTGGVSTLWFNANPLTRMDGYYLLSDLAHLPNLAERSATWWREQWLRRLLRVTPTQPLQPASRETPWLAGYALAAWTYRVALLSWLTIWLGGHYAPAGIAMALVTFATMGVMPIIRLLRVARAQTQDRHQVSNARRRLALGLASIALLALCVPVPDRVVAVGIVWVPETAQIRAGDDGFVTRLSSTHGQNVELGQSILALNAPVLHAEARKLDTQRARLNASRSAALFTDPAQGASWTEALRQIDDERSRLSQRIASLDVQAPLAGRLVLPFAEDLLGRFFRRGEHIADVLDEQAPIVRLVLASDQIIRIADGPRQVRLGFNHLPWQAIDADLLREAPAPIDQLPSAALATSAGGPIEVDPADKDRLKPLHPVYALDVQARHKLATYPGERVDVSIDCGWRTLAVIAARELRHTFRAGFSAQSI